MLSAVMLNVIMLSVTYEPFMLIVVMLSVVMLNVVYSRTFLFFLAYKWV